MDHVKISFLDVENSAHLIQNENESIKETLLVMKGLMNELQSFWQSDSQTVIVERFNAMQPRFDQYYDVVVSYVHFLNETIENYRAVEKTLVDNASNF